MYKVAKADYFLHKILGSPKPLKSKCLTNLKMFYEIKAKSHVRVPPNLLKEDINHAILNRLNETFEGYISQDVGFVVIVTDVLIIGEGVIIPVDGEPYYYT